MADSIRHLIEEAVKSSMRERNKERTSTLRMALSELKKEEIDNKIELSNEDSIKILQRMIKQRKESMSQFLNAQRNDLAEKEELEIVILQDFLPEQMSEEDINKLVIEAINETDAKELKDIGKVMGFLKTKIQGNADMGIVSKLVKENLQG
ncbi:MAG: GatB/YqeY domain-containing protein [Pseudomonadota bacterium]|nr:GatB/YqeY domain-containing protein [Pseudomonadota bacterium]